MNSMFDQEWTWLYEPVDRLPTTDINAARGNTVRHVVRDAARRLHLRPQDAATLARILVFRGVAKWLRARKAIVTLVEHRMRQVIARMRPAAGAPPESRAYAQGYTEATRHWRRELRRICRGPRRVLGADADDAQWVRALLEHAGSPEELQAYRECFAALDEAGSRDPRIGRALLLAYTQCRRHYDAPCGIV